MKNQLLMAGVLLLGLAFAPNNAKADLSGSIDLERTSNSSIFGSSGERLFRNVSVSVNGGTSSGVAAGLFRVTEQNTTNDFLAFCIEITQNISLPTTYNINQTQPVAAVVGLLDKLFTTYVDDVDTRDEAAAFQVAVWEIIYDGASGPLDTGVGNFRLTNSNAQVDAQADSYLTNLSSQAGGDYSLYFLNNVDYQDLIVWDDNTSTQVSAPSLIALILLSMGAMVFASRKR